MYHPHSGKTSTMVEAINQYGRYHPQAKILVCAPSNAAADVLLRRLARSISHSEMFRFMSFQRERSTVDATVSSYCLYGKEGEEEGEGYQFPGLQKLLSYRYVVCTCIMAGKLANHGVKRGK